MLLLSTGHDFWTRTEANANFTIGKAGVVKSSHEYLLPMAVAGRGGKVMLAGGRRDARAERQHCWQGLRWGVVAKGPQPASWRTDPPFPSPPCCPQARLWPAQVRHSAPRREGLGCHVHACIASCACAPSCRQVPHPPRLPDRPPPPPSPAGLTQLPGALLQNIERDGKQASSWDKDWVLAEGDVLWFACE